MSKHFKLTNESIQVGTTTLYRIEATKDLPTHGVKVGDKGGFVAKLENLSDNAWVYGNAQVSGDAWVYGNARVYGDARVYGNARVYGDAWVTSRQDLFHVIWKSFSITITPQNISCGCILWDRFGKENFAKGYKKAAKDNDVDDKTRAEFVALVKLGCKIVPAKKAVKK